LHRGVEEREKHHTVILVPLLSKITAKNLKNGKVNGKVDHFKRKENIFYVNNTSLNIEKNCNLIITTLEL